MVSGTWVAVSSAYDKTTEVRVVQIIKGLRPFGDFSINEDIKYRPIIILATEEGRGFCSGTIIDNHYILTAAHCLVDEDGHLKREPVQLLSDVGEKTEVMALPAGVNLKIDYGVLTGNFGQFGKLPADFYDIPFVDKTASYITCGFPSVQHHLTCGQLLMPMPMMFQYAFQGMLFPGMSGGPVLANVNGALVIFGVNSAVFGSEDVKSHNVIIAPLTGLLGSFGIEPLRR